MLELCGLRDILFAQCLHSKYHSAQAEHTCVSRILPVAKYSLTGRTEPRDLEGASRQAPLPFAFLQKKRPDGCEKVNSRFSASERAGTRDKAAASEKTVSRFFAAGKCRAWGAAEGEEKWRRAIFFLQARYIFLAGGFISAPS